jgi:hypothetical protein
VAEPVGAHRREDGRQEGRRRSGRRRGDAQIRPHALGPLLDETGLAQERDVTRHGALRHRRGSGQFADVQLLAVEEPEQPQPGRVGGGAEGGQGVVEGFHASMRMEA